MTLIDPPTCSRQHVLWKWIMRGTLQGHFAGLPPTGERFEVRGATALVTTDNRIVRCADYFNPRDIADQKGHEETRSPNPGGTWPVVSSTDLLFPADEDNIAYGE